MPNLTLSASHIGAAAYKTLRDETSATVLGAISQGIYLRTPGRRIIYLSYKANHGPLTMNLQQIPADPPSIAPGEPVNIGPTALDWQNGTLRILLESAQTWFAPICLESRPADDGWLQRLQRIAAALAGAKAALADAADLAVPQ